MLTGFRWITLAGVLIVLAASCGPKEQKAVDRPFKDRVIFANGHGSIMLSDLVATNRSDAGVYVYKSPSKVPAAARMYHQTGLKHAASGEGKNARYFFNKSHKEAEDWPYPLYDHAELALKEGDFEEALSFYQAVMERAPSGFFGTIPAIDALEREAKGELPKGTWQAYRQYTLLGSLDSKRYTIQELLKTTEDFAPFWKERALLEGDDEQRLEFLERGLAAAPDRESEGELVVEKALVLSRRGDHDAAVALLGRMTLDPQSTEGCRQRARKKLAQLVAPPPAALVRRGESGNEAN